MRIPLCTILVILGCLAAAGTGAMLSTGHLAADRAEDRLAAAATKFLDSLTPELRGKAARPFDDLARTDWHYVPRTNAGVTFSEMNEQQRIAARGLMRAALSSQGMNKVEEIMLLESVLAEFEKGAVAVRDSLAYSIAVFGSPPHAAAGDAAHPWGWRLQGHHLSLNFTGVKADTAVTPAFLGSNPGEVRQGARAGVRVLAAEEDLARELLAMLTLEQRSLAIISDVAPRDILAIPGRSLEEVDSLGLAVSAMNADQRTLIERLLAEYANNLQHDLAERELQRMRDAGLEQVRFAWMGSVTPGKGHYYRLSGPTFVIEYDNTQNDANHVHTVWRDRQRDFGRDLLKEHLDRDHTHEHSHGPHSH